MITLAPARWKGGPLICPAANLPAFPTEKAAAQFREDNCPSCKVRTKEEPSDRRDPVTGAVLMKQVQKQWLCEHCGHWHYDGQAPDPAGNSSGLGRGESGAPKGFVPFRRSATSIRNSSKSSAPELKDAHGGWKGPWCVKCESPVKGGKCINKECVVHGPKEPKPAPAATASKIVHKPVKVDPNQMGMF